MAYKRQTDRLPIIPRTPKSTTSYATTASSDVATKLILGRWTSRAQRPAENKFGIDLSKQQAPRPWLGTRRLCITSSGKTGHVQVVIKPDKLRR